ncbi:MAG: hypothetical protein HN675_03830 [Opitutae bacterium]|nr:hypothetical protein [Opitutae bacterium]MBT7852425.1 hypothetical protein [Opitutae bacterium]
MARIQSQLRLLLEDAMTGITLRREERLHLIVVRMTQRILLPLSKGASRGNAYDGGKKERM